jgi:hypothetical protein
MSDKSMTNFLEWARVRQPQFYAQFVAKMNPTGLGGWMDIFTTAVSAVKDYRADKNVKKQLDINLERARQGHDPIDFSRSTPNQPYPAALPVAPITPYPTTGSGVSMPNNTVMLAIAGGLVALLFFMRKGKK